MTPSAGRARTIAVAAGVALLLGLGLTSCAPANDSAAAMHDSVVRVSQRAADADYAGALAELALLEADVDDAAADGDLDAAQEQEIRDALALVRSDLEAAEVAASPTPTPAPSTDDSDDSSGPGNSDDSPGDNGNKGKGKGKGKGKDKGEDD